MKASGPCKVLFHNGEPCLLYEVVTVEETAKGFNNTRYYFANEREAELYIYYLYYIIGKADIARKLHSKKVAEWEKRELRLFEMGLNVEDMLNAVALSKPTIETSFVPKRK